MDRIRCLRAQRLGAWAVLALACCVAAPVAAGPYGPGGARGPRLGALLDHHADELGLDDATREAIRAIVTASHEQESALREEIREERRRLRQQLSEDPVDRDAVLGQVERVGELEIEADKHRIETLLEIRALLTPEQREALKGLRERFRDHHLAPVLDACREELAERCPERGPRALHCLHRHRDLLSEPCAEALSAMPLPPHHPPGLGWHGGTFPHDGPPEPGS